MCARGVGLQCVWKCSGLLLVLFVFACVVCALDLLLPLVRVCCVCCVQCVPAGFRTGLCACVCVISVCMLFSRANLCVCVSVCLSVRLSVCMWTTFMKCIFVPNETSNWSLVLRKAPVMQSGPYVFCTSTKGSNKSRAHTTHANTNKTNNNPEHYPHTQEAFTHPRR